MNNSSSQFHIDTGEKNTPAPIQLRPDLKAAITVLVFLIGFEILGDLLPFVGYLITFPITLAVYYFQGFLTGVFMTRDARYRSAATWRYAGMGFTSSLWTGIIFAFVLTLFSYLVTTPFSLGLNLAELPFTLLTFLLDLFLNIIFTTLAAWFFGLLNRAAFTGISCLLLVIALGLACVIEVLLGVSIIRILANIIPHLPSYIPFLRH
ncbi:MAG: hypothetical protein P4L50_15075 [Anaerolineaceae bacterium]|nr:hypothetical protein [Anaerolineaceae bacterium]